MKSNSRTLKTFKDAVNEYNKYFPETGKRSRKSWYLNLKKSINEAIQDGRLAERIGNNLLGMMRVPEGC